MNLLPLILYAAAGVAYAIHFARRDVDVGRTATTLLLLAVLTHTFVIGMQTMEVRHVPFANPSRAVSTFVWLLTLSYLYLELTTDERSMGVFILPIIVGLQLIPVLSPGVENRDPLLDSPWFWVHVSSLLFAYASFGLAGVLGAHLRAAVQGNQEEAPRLLLHAPAVAADPRPHELPRNDDRLGVPHARPHRRRRLDARSACRSRQRTATCRRCR